MHYSEGQIVRMMADFLLETVQVSKQWKASLKCWKNPKLSMKLSFKNKSKIKILSDKKKLRELIASKPTQ